jgi:hypothetical protein
MDESKMSTLKEHQSKMRDSKECEVGKAAKCDENKKDDNELELEEVQVSTSDSMLEMANEEIHKLNNQLMIKESRLEKALKRADFYEQAVKNLLTFSQ